MCLTIQNQLTLLHDLLDEQMTLKSVSVNEYRQIKKLVQTMTTNKAIEEELQAILPEIYCYGIKGEQVSSLDDHIIDNEQNIRTWLQLIQQTKTNICAPSSQLKHLL